MAARLAQVNPELVAATEHEQPLMQRLLDNLGAARQTISPVTIASSDEERRNYFPSIRGR